MWRQSRRGRRQATNHILSAILPIFSCAAIGWTALGWDRRGCRGCGLSPRISSLASWTTTESTFGVRTYSFGRSARLDHVHTNGKASKRSSLTQSLIDAQVQAAVRLALWAGARDVHVTVNKAGNTKRNIFGNDYRVRLLDAPPEEWVPMLKKKIHVVLDYTGGFSFGTHSTSSIVEKVMCKKTGRYVGCLGEGCSSPALNVGEEAPIDKKKQSTWSEGLSMLQGQKGCTSPGSYRKEKNSDT